MIARLRSSKHTKTIRIKVISRLFQVDLTINYYLLCVIYCFSSSSILPHLLFFLASFLVCLPFYRLQVFLFFFLFLLYYFSSWLPLWLSFFICCFLLCPSSCASSPSFLLLLLLSCSCSCPLIYSHLIGFSDQFICRDECNRRSANSIDDHQSHIVRRPSTKAVS